MTPTSHGSLPTQSTETRSVATGLALVSGSQGHAFPFHGMPRRGCVVSRTLVQAERELLGTFEKLAMNGSPLHQALAQISARSVVIPSAIQEPSKAVHSRRS